MHYIGIDLAWGQRNPTGIAVVDADARLLRVEAVLTDEEVLAGLAPYAEGDCVVAIDAPIVVTNEKGSRPAEQQLNADFAAHHAGAHPSNTGKPEFRDGTRAGRLARALKLDTDPRSRRRRRAVEVYPHPATIVLFGLDKVLRYKHKPGRDLDLLRSELLTLMGHVESLVQVDLEGDGGPGAGWATLRAAVEGATQKVQLRRVEDQVDAVLCAYLALFVDTRPELVTTYGDAETGAILTPTKGAPVGARRPGRAQLVREAVQAYEQRHPELVLAAEEAVALVTDVLDEAGIDYLSVTGRAKSVASFAEKATRTEAGRALYPDPLVDIRDQVGVRVITYVRDDVATVADLLAEQLRVVDDRDLGRETAREGRFGYASRHLMLGVDGRDPQGSARRSRPVPAHLVDRLVQVQVRTVLQHAWAEFEHDIRYKGSVPAEHAGEFDRRFTLAAGLLELADQEFSAVRERLRGSTTPSADDDLGLRGLDGRDGDPDDPRIRPRELAAFLAGQYADAGWSRPDHYAWLAGLLTELGITELAGPDGLGELLRRADDAAIAERMEYRHPPGAVRRLDDALVWVLGERYADLPGNAHRVDLLHQRLERMRAES